MASARPSRRPVQRTRSAVAVAVAALALTGCSATNPIATQQVHNVGDGRYANITEDVAVQNLIVFTAEEGAVGTMTGAVDNKGREDARVTLRPDGGDAVTFDVPARGTVLLGGDGEQVEIESVAAAPGALLTVAVEAGASGSVEFGVPVLDGTLPEYTDVVPEADADDEE